MSRVARGSGADRTEVTRFTQLVGESYVLVRQEKAEAQALPKLPPPIVLWPGVAFVGGHLEPHARSDDFRLPQRAEKDSSTSLGLRILDEPLGVSILFEHRFHRLINGQRELWRTWNRLQVGKVGGVGAVGMVTLDFTRADGMFRAMKPLALLETLEWKPDTELPQDYRATPDAETNSRTAVVCLCFEDRELMPLAHMPFTASAGPVFLSLSRPRIREETSSEALIEALGAALLGER